MSDDENDNYITSPQRIEKLKFKPQKEIFLNNLLPYADQLDEESTKLFAEIKCNLGKAVMMREMKPGCGVWTARLIKYLRIYGLKFSKEDHIALVKLVYEMILIPDLEPSKIQKFATLFVMLTKKRYLITPEELTLPWRPLYDVSKKIFEKSTTHIGMFHFITSLESSFLGLVKCAKPYFELNATQEILDQLMPQISPWSPDTSETIDQLALFLPVSLPPEHADKSYKLWFKDLMDLWETCYSSHCGVGELLWLFANLAKRSPGSIDWTPYVPFMFTKFLRAFNLPVGYKDTQPLGTHALEIKEMANWIVWTINPDGLVLKHLRSFLGGLESYLHSANSGRWSYKLRLFLRKLSREFLNRVRRERSKLFTESWENKTPDHLKLRDSDITEFVEVMLEPTILAVYSRSGSVDVSHALQHLATMRPAIVVPPLIDRLRSSMESLTEPHRVTAAMQAVAAVARPILRGGSSDYPEGPTHVVPLLLASLPGLDANDTKKTLVSLHFMLIFCWMVPIIDCSSAAEYWDDLTEEEQLTCESTAQFEDFVLLYLERIFAIVESSILENARLETREADAFRSRVETVVESALSSTTNAILEQCSPKIFGEALRKFKKFATENTFETNVSGSIVGSILRVFARVDAASTLAAMLPELCSDLNELLATDEAIKDENPPRELLYKLLLVAHIVECHDGTVLLKYIPMLEKVLDRALKLQTKPGYHRACDILAHTMFALSMLELHERKSSWKDYSTAPREWLPIREWGNGCPPREAKFSWHVPNAEEVAAAQKLMDKYALPELEKIRSMLEDEASVDRKKRLRSLTVLYACLSCTTLMPPADEPPIKLITTQVPATTFQLYSGVTGELKIRDTNARAAVSVIVSKLQAHMLSQKSDDTQSLEMMVKIWERVSGIRPAYTGLSLEARLRAYAALERTLDGRGGPSPGAGRVRTLLADAVRMQDEHRHDMHIECGIGETGLRVLMGLYELSVNTYTSVRMQAQLRLYWMLSHHAYSFRALLPKLTELLATGGEGEEWHARHKGALYVMLGPRSGPLVAKQDWEVTRTLWPAVLKAPLSEKPSLVRIEQGFSETLHRQFPTVNTKLEFTDSCVEVAKCLLSESEYTDEEFQSKLKTSKEYEKEISDKNERMYLELVEELVTVAETPNLQWRRLELAMQMLTYCPNLQTPYPPNAVRLIVNSLVHDNITVRRLAVKLTLYSLKHRKRPHKKMKVDPYEIAGVPRPEKPIPGYRKELEWALWSEDRIPKNDEQWERPWLKSPLIGFYAWPKELEVSAPSHEQPNLDRSPDEMEEGERHIWEFFNSETNVQRLVNFLTVEEKKGKDKFNGLRFAMFTRLFRNFGDTLPKKFLVHALKHASDTQEASQRFASEVVAAAIKAPKHWGRERALGVYEEAVKVFRAGLTAVTPEMTEDWGTCIASAVENMDPLRGAPIIKALVDLCAPAPALGVDVETDQESSFGVCARLYALQGAISALSWRGAPLAADVLQKLEAARFTQHPYQNVRERVGSILMSILDTGLVLPGGSTGPAPQLAEFLADIRLRLTPLYDEHGEIVIKTALASTPMIERAASLPETPPEPELPAGNEALVTVGSVARLSPDGPVPETTHEQGTDKAKSVVGLTRNERDLAARLEVGLQLCGDDAVTANSPRDHARASNLLATVLRGCVGLMVNGAQGATLDHYGLLRTACALSTRGPPQPHDELGRAADAFLACLAVTHHDARSFDAALASVEEVSQSRSWWARLSCVEFAQALLFYGLPLLCQNPEKAVRAEAFALKLMRDKRLEVRQRAAKLLTGLMHCQALPHEDQTLEKLMRFCRSKELVERHCGVLGLCAYLSSRPYSLGPKIGVVLAELSRHTSAPDPVPSAIRLALADFRRTHQDDWPTHRAALTEEELDLLADLTSPPAYCA